MKKALITLVINQHLQCPGLLSLLFFFSLYGPSVSYSNAAKFSVNMEDDLLNLSNSRVLELEDKQN